jgi:hypothetical protein
MEFLKNLGIAGFWFFLIKGLLWLILIGAVSMGWIKKDRLSFFKRTTNHKRK